MRISAHFHPLCVQIRADIEVTCFGYEGIDAIKAALVAGKQCSTEAMPIKVYFSFEEKLESAWIDKFSLYMRIDSKITSPNSPLNNLFDGKQHELLQQ